MRSWDDPILDPEEVLPGPFKVTPGFIAFVGVLLLPAVAALGIFVGAALVVDEVHAAERSASVSGTESSFNVVTAEGKPVAGWKKALVGVCPAH
jgi:hypothetical protein